MRTTNFPSLPPRQSSPTAQEHIKYGLKQSKCEFGEGRKSLTNTRRIIVELEGLAGIQRDSNLLLFQEYRIHIELSVILHGCKVQRNLPM